MSWLLFRISTIFSKSEFSNVSGPLMQIWIKQSKFASLSDVLSREQIKFDAEKQLWTTFDIVRRTAKVILDNVACFTAQKMKFFIKDFFSKCDQIRRKLRIWSHLLKKSLMENFNFCAVFFNCFRSHLLSCICKHQLPLIFLHYKVFSPFFYKFRLFL